MKSQVPFTCRVPGKRAPGFIAIGDMALALAAAGCARGMEPVLPRLAEQVREAITVQRGRKGGTTCPEALQVQTPVLLSLPLQGAPYHPSLSRHK